MLEFLDEIKLEIQQSRDKLYRSLFSQHLENGLSVEKSRYKALETTRQVLECPKYHPTVQCSDTELF